MAAAIFILFMVSVSIFGFVFLFLTFRHYRQLALSQTSAAKSVLVKPPESK